MRVAQAVYNNAVWCDTVCRTHDQAGEFLDGIWLTQRAAPPFYPNAVTLADARAATAQIACIRKLIDADIPGAWGVKDSFCTLDLASLGFQHLFDGTWIGWSSAQARPEADIAGIHWSQVRSATELTAWEAAWRGTPSDTMDDSLLRIFLPALLMDETIAVIAFHQDDRIVAGAIANYSGEVVGLSNVFVPAQDDARFRAGCIAAVMDLFPDLPLVGYESGSDLAAFRALGFEELGPLRVWVRANESADLEETAR